jgi:hypothetical protein
MAAPERRTRSPIQAVAYPPHFVIAAPDAMPWLPLRELGRVERF